MTLKEKVIGIIEANIFFYNYIFVGGVYEFYLTDTKYYCEIDIAHPYGEICWYKRTNSNDEFLVKSRASSFSEVLSDVPRKIAEKLIYHMDLFT